MFNKNVFTQKDPLADLIKDINEADFKAKMEALKGNQHKIDKNKNNKIDAHDFKILRGEKKVNEDQVEEAAESPFTSWKKPRQPEPSGGSGIKQGTRYGGSKQKDKPEQETDTKKEEIDPSVKTTDTLRGVIGGKSANPFLKAKVKLNVNEEDLEQVEAEALIENVEIINEVSLGAKIKAYAQHSSDAFQHGDMGNDDEAEHHEKRADKILAHIEKHHGAEAVKHAQKAAHSEIFGRGGHSRGSDSLSGGLRSNLQTTVTKAGKIPKNTQSAIVNRRKTYGSRVVGPKGSLPEEVEMNERELSKGETAEKERIVKGMKKSLAGFKARYGDKAKSVMYATATARAKKD